MTGAPRDKLVGRSSTLFKKLKNFPLKNSSTYTGKTNLTTSGLDRLGEEKISFVSNENIKNKNLVFDASSSYVSLISKYELSGSSNLTYLKTTQAGEGLRLGGLRYANLLSLMSTKKSPLKKDWVGVAGTSIPKFKRAEWVGNKTTPTLVNFRCKTNSLDTKQSFCIFPDSPQSISLPTRFSGSHYAGLSKKPYIKNLPGTTAKTGFVESRMMSEILQFTLAPSAYFKMNFIDFQPLVVLPVLDKYAFEDEEPWWDEW